MDSNTIHNPTGQKVVTWHRTNFWMLTCFDDSYWFWRNLDVRPAGLESLGYLQWSSYPTPYHSLFQTPLCKQCDIQCKTHMHALLETTLSHLSLHIKNVESRVYMHFGRQIWCNPIPESTWMQSQVGLGRLRDVDALPAHFWLFSLLQVLVGPLQGS